jgi:hypothetical protein
MTLLGGTIAGVLTPRQCLSTGPFQLSARWRYRTKFAAVMVIKVGDQRQLTHPLSTVQQHYLRALRVPATSFTTP